MSETERDLPCTGWKGIFYSVGCKFVDDQSKRHGVFGGHGKRLRLDTNMDCWRITEQAFADRLGDALQILSDLDRAKSRGSRYEVIELRDYTRAKERLARTCSGDDSGQGPYACKYLGWMSFTGTGVPRNLDEAFGKLAKACFFHNDAILIDPEGCHFLGRTALELRGRSQRDAGRADHLAYIAFAQGCTDNARTVCDEARALYRREAARAASWIKRCDSDVGEHGAIGSCAELAISGDDYDAAQATRRQLASMFRAVSTSSD